MKIVTTILIIATLTSCYDKKLNLEITENKEIKLEQYDISRITTIHEYVDITNKKWKKTERIYEANSDELKEIIISNDTIYLITRTGSPTIYDLAAIKFGYKIIVESNKAFIK